MNIVRKSVAGFLWLFVFFAASVRGQMLPEQRVEKSVVTVIDSLTIDLSKMDSTICIDSQVVLSFNNDSIFSCEWIDMETEDTISRQKTVTLSPQTTHQYRVNLYYFTGELIEGGDFESGKNFYTQYREGEISSGKQWWKNPPVWGDIPELWKVGTYKIGKSPIDYHPLFSTIKDHTTGTGNMLLVNGATTGDKIVWRKTITGIRPNVLYAFSAWGSAIGCNNPANFHFTINGKTLGVDKHLTDLKDVNNGIWEQFYELWEADLEEAEIALVNLETQGDGNDFAIDDISFASLQKKTGVITVKVLPAVDLENLKDQEVCEGGPVRVDANASGSGTLVYKWKKNGVVLPGQEQQFEILSATLADSGSYICSVTGECGVRKQPFRVDVRPLLKVNTLTDTVRPCEGEDLVFTVETEQGYLPAYTWVTPHKKTGWFDVDLPVLTIPDIHWERDTGLYFCRIATQCGIDTVYQVVKAPEKLLITDCPPDMAVCPGSTIGLTAQTNIPAREMTWTKMNTGEKTSGNILLLPDIQEKDEGTYCFSAIDKCGVGDVCYVKLGVLPPLSGFIVSSDTMVCEGGNAVFRVYAEGRKTEYKWRGPNGFKASTAEIVIAPVTPERIGTYHVTATDSCGNTITDKVQLSLLTEYDHLNISDHQEVCPGDSVRLEVKGGDKGLDYDWTLPDGRYAKGAAIKVSAVAGEYICRITGICAPVEKSATVAVRQPLQAKIVTDYFKVCPDEKVHFEVRATGAGLAYEWMKEGTVTGRQPEFSIPQAVMGNAGEYLCRVSSLCGDSLLYGRLEVREPLQITEVSSDRYVRKGETTSLFIQVEGDEQRTYKWLADGQLLPDADGSRITVTAPEVEGVVTYTVQVRGCNTVSATIRLIVNDYVNIRKDTAIMLCRGQEYAYRVIENDCESSKVKSWWTWDGKIVAEGNALIFNPFVTTQRGEYVFYSESDCGNTELHLTVDTLPEPRIVTIFCENARKENDKLIVCTGEKVRLKAEASTYGSVTYEWMYEGEVIPGVSGAILDLGRAREELRGKYTCRVIDGECGEDVKEIELEVYKKLELNYIPVAEVCPGATALLQLNVTASVPCGFIWSGPEKNAWVAESNGYTTSYKNAGVTAESAGVYECKVSNVCGEAKAVFQLIVEQKPELIAGVQGDTLCPGETAVLKVPVGQPGMKYSWILPDKEVVNYEILTVQNFSEADTGVYRYSVTTRNGCFHLEGEMKLDIQPPLQLVWINNDTLVCEGGEVHLKAVAKGNKIKYEWYGPQGYYAEGSDLVIGPVTQEQFGLYEVVVTDRCERVGERGQVNVNPLKEFEGIVIAPEFSECEGKDIVLKVTSPYENLHYKWFFGDRTVGNGKQLELSHLTMADTGVYVCSISGECGMTERQVHVEVFPQLVTDPFDYAPVCEREDLVLRTGAKGKDVVYHWMKAGEEIGIRADSLELKDILPSDAGLYECHITSACGEALLPYEVRIKENTRILFSSPDRTVTLEDTCELMVEAMGENKRYHWSCNEEVLAETGRLIRVIAPQNADTLEYKCIVTGDCGVDSVKIQIKVGQYIRLHTDLKDTLCEGSNYKYNVTLVPPGAFAALGLNYCWTFNGEVLYNGTNSVFPLKEVKAGQTGDYVCKITTLDNAPEYREAFLTLHIEVLQIPELESVTPDLYLVEGKRDSVKVVVTGNNLSYSWTKDDLPLDTISSVIYFDPVTYQDRGLYKVRVFNRCSHVEAKTQLEVWKKTVIVYPHERDDSVCMAEDIQLKVLAWGEEGLLYKWYFKDEPLDVPLVQPLSINKADKTDEGDYMCIVKGRGGEDTCRINLKVLDLPGADIKGKFSICRDEENATQVYTARTKAERVDYFWQVKSGEIRSGMFAPQTMVTWDRQHQGILGLEVVSLVNGCRSTAMDTLEYKSLPEVRLTVPAYVGYCTDTLQLIRAYPWGGQFLVENRFAEVVHFDNKSVSYPVEYRYTDPETECSARDFDTIRLATRPEIRLAVDTVRTGWCVPVNMEVIYHTDGKISWGGEPFPEVIDETHAVYQALAYTADFMRFTVKLTDVYTCSAVDTLIAVLENSPSVSLMADTIIGECNELLLKGKYDLHKVQSVLWNPAGAVRKIDEFTAELSDKGVGEHIVDIAVSDQYGCVGRDTVKVIVQAAPVLSDEEVCLGNTIQVDASRFDTFTWEDGYTGNQRELKEAGKYVLVVKDDYGCEVQAEYRVRPLPVVYLTDTLIYEGQQVEFIIEPEPEYGPYRYCWQDGSTASSFLAEKEGEYSVRVTDSRGCYAADTAFLTVKKWYIAAPDAFLPGSSGQNSRFYLKEVNFGSSFDMYIYDRWGELVFHTHEIGFNGGWDGTFKGMDCQPGAYVWVAFVDGKEVGKGTLVLVK